MKEKVKLAAIRALWTFLQTAFGVWVAKGAMTGGFSTEIWEIIGPSLAAAALSFAKSIGVGMPEADSAPEPDGELEVAIPPNADATPFITGGVRWNPGFNLKERVEETEPVITLSIKRNFETNKNLYRQLRL